MAGELVDSWNDKRRENEKMTDNLTNWIMMNQAQEHVEYDMKLVKSPYDILELITHEELSSIVYKGIGEKIK